MQFELNTNTEVKVSKPNLEGYKIHEVEFKGVEKADYKDGLYKVIVLKFENEQGRHFETIFEPKEADGKRTQSQFGENPSRVEHIQRMFQILAEEFNPEFLKTLKVSGKLTWDNMRDLFVDSTKAGIGKKTMIKLYKNNKGEAQFPGFFLSIDKEGVVYQNTTFIGKNLTWNSKELKKLNQVLTASPTRMTKVDELGVDSEPVTPAPKTGLKLNDLSGL